MPEAQYQDYIFRRPDTGVYYSIVNGAAREFTDQNAAAALAPNAKMQNWGTGTAGYSEQHGGGTTGGAWDVANFKNTLASLINTQRPVSQQVTVPEYTNPNAIKAPESTFNTASTAPSQSAAGRIIDTRPGSPTLGLMVPDYNQGGTQGTQSDARSLISTKPQTGYIKAYDTNNDYAQVYVPAGKYVPGVSLYPKSSDSITPNKLQTEKPLIVPGATSNMVDQSGAIVAGATTALDQIIKNLTPAQTETEKKQQTLLDQMASLVGDQANKAADQLTAEQSANLPQLRQQFADINAEILTKTAQYKALQTENQNKPITMNSIIGNERAIQNAAAADIGLLQARALGLQGQIATAQETVNRAVDLKYDTIQKQLDVYEAQLNALLPSLNKEEKIQATAQQQLLEQRKQALEDQKTEQKNIQNTVLEAIKAGITNSNILSSISSAKSYDQALQILGKNMPNSNVQDLQNKYPDAGIVASDTFAQAQTKLRNSKIYLQQTRLAGGGGSSRSGGGGVSQPNSSMVASSGAQQIDLNTALQFALSGLTKDARTNATKTFNTFINQGKTNEAKQYIDKLLMDKLPNTQKEEVATMGTVSQLANQILAYNQDGKLEGVGFGTGTLGQLTDKIFGNATPEARNVRILIGNIKGTIAKLRGGTSFTPNEEKLLESYTPSINENSTVVVNKLQSLQDFILQKRDATLYGGQADIFNAAPENNSGSLDAVKNKYKISY